MLLSDIDLLKAYCAATWCAHGNPAQDKPLTRFFFSSAIRSSRMILQVWSCCYSSVSVMSYLHGIISALTSLPNPEMASSIPQHPSHLLQSR